MLERAGADFYCPDYHFLDAEAVGQVSAAAKRVIPYTVNEPARLERLIAWGVHGITTDVPDRLLQWAGAIDGTCPLLSLWGAAEKNGSRFARRAAWQSSSVR